MAKKIFEAEIRNDSPRGYETATTLKLPATWAGFNDALQKARIEDGRHCRNELTKIRYEGIVKSMIGEDVDLYDLNLLAQRLAALTEDQKVGMDALLKMERERRAGPIPLERLINLTYHTDICALAPQVSNHQELGAFLYENGMLSDEAIALLDTMEQGSDLQKRLLELLGEQHQEEHGGVFTSRGYAELGGDIKDTYASLPGEAACFHRSAPVVLKVTKGYFDDPSYDNDKTTILALPATDTAIARAVEAVDAASEDECAFSCTDCLIPSLRDAINDVIDEEGGIEQVNGFAQMLAQKERVWGVGDLVKYKALLSASGDPSLQDAMWSMHVLDAYELRPDMSQTWEYAEAVLREKYPDLPEALFHTPQAAQVGQELLEKDNAVLTDYGLLRRKDGGPLLGFRQEQAAVPAEDPILKGMELTRS